MQQVATAVCPSDGVAGVVIAKQMRKLPIIPHLHTVHVHFPNLWIKLNPVSSLWESSNHFEPFFTTHTNGLGSVPFTAPVLPENECYSSAFLPVSHMTVHKSHWSFTFFFFVETQISPSFFHRSQDFELLLHWNHFREIPCHKDRMATLFSHSASSPSLWPFIVVSEANACTGCGDLHGRWAFALFLC